jgi:hypothetical protein
LMLSTSAAPADRQKVAPPLIRPFRCKHGLNLNAPS